MTYEKIHESEYGDGPRNFHVAKSDSELHVTLTYPPWTDADNKTNQCCYVVVNQEATRASDGLRLYYDYSRDGFVVQQPKPYLVRVGDSYETRESWTEVGFFQSWALEDEACEFPTPEHFAAADRDALAAEEWAHFSGEKK